MTRVLIRTYTGWRRYAPAAMAAAMIVIAAAGVRTADLSRIAAQPGSPAQEEFIPIDQLPPADQLPAAPLLIAAYVFVWVAALAYFWSIWRRLAKLERELAAVSQRKSDKERRA